MKTALYATLSLLGVIAQALFSASIVTDAGRIGDFPSALWGWFVFLGIVWIIVYAVARAKRRHVSSWLGATLLCGPLTLLVLLFVPSVKPTITKVCPHCQSDIPEKASVCRFCARSVPQVSTA